MLEDALAGEVTVVVVSRLLCGEHLIKSRKRSLAMKGFRGYRNALYPKAFSEKKKKKKKKLKELRGTQPDLTARVVVASGNGSRWWLHLTPNTPSEGGVMMKCFVTFCSETRCCGRKYRFGCVIMCLCVFMSIIGSVEALPILCVRCAW